MFYLQYTVEDVLPRPRTFRSELRTLSNELGAEWEEPGDSPATSPLHPTPGAPEVQRIVQISKTQHAQDRLELHETASAVTPETFSSLSSVPTQQTVTSQLQRTSQVQNVPRNISVLSNEDRTDSRDVSIPSSVGAQPGQPTMQSVITMKCGSTVPKGQVLYVLAMMNPKTGKRLSLEQAIATGLFDMQSGMFVDPRVNKKITLSEANRQGFVDGELLRLLQQKAGISDPSTRRELSIQEAIQQGLYDPMTGQVKHPRTGRYMSLSEASKQGVISNDAAESLSFIRISTRSTAQSQGYYCTPSLRDSLIKISLKDVLDKELYEAESGKLIDPLSMQKMSFSEALQQEILDVNVKEIIHPVTGVKLNIPEAVSQGVLDTKSGRFIDPRSKQKMALDAASRRHLIRRPISLHEALTEGIITSQGHIRDLHKGKKVSFSQAMENGLIDTECRCIIDPQTQEIMSVQEALSNGLITPTGQFSDPHSGRRIPLSDAVSHGKLQVVGKETVFPSRGVIDSATNEKVTLSEAINRGCFHPSTAAYYDKTRGRSLSLPDACKDGWVDPMLVESLEQDSGLKDIVGNSLSVLDLLKRGLIDIQRGLITQPISSQSLSIEDAVTANVLEAERAEVLLQLTSQVTSVTTITTSIQHSDPLDRPPINVADAVRQGLVDETRGVFTDPTTGEVMRLDQAVSKGVIDVSSPEEESMDISSQYTSPSQSTISSRTSGSPQKAFSPVREPGPLVSAMEMSAKGVGHVTIEDGDSYEREIEGGKEQVTWSQKQEFFARRVQGGTEATSIQSSKMSHVTSTSDTVVSGDLTFPISARQAIDMNLLQTKSGKVRHPISTTWMDLGEAIGEANIIDPRSATFIHPDTKTHSNLKEALNANHLDSTGHYTDPRTREKLTLDELLQEGVVVLKDGLPKSKIPVISEESKKQVVKAVLDPKSGRMLDTKEAIKRGLLDMKTGKYKHPITGEIMSIKDAVNAGFIATEASKSDIDVDSMKAIKETKSFTIRGVMDPETWKVLDVKTAMNRGMLDQVNALYQYRDSQGNDVSMPISEAIQQGLVIADTGAPKSEKPKYIKEVQSFTITGVLDPNTKKPLSVSEAINQGILDHANGQYVNPKTNEAMLITDAIHQGLIIADIQTSVSETDTPTTSQVIAARKLVCTLKSVKHPVTEEELTPREAIVKGILDQEKGEYRNPVTGKVMTIDEAIEKGFVVVVEGRPTEETDQDEVESVHIDDGEVDDDEEMIREEVTEETKSFQITGVTDLRTGDIKTLDEALTQGIIDQERGVFYNTSTGSEIPINEALNDGLIVGQLVSSSEEQELFRSAVVSTKISSEMNLVSVLNPITGLAIPVTQAVRMGLLSPDKKTFYDPTNEKKMPVDEAINIGLVNPTKADIAKATAKIPKDVYDDVQQEQKDVKPRAIIDWTNGAVKNSLTGEKMRIQDALDEGLIDKPTADLLSKKAETVPFYGLSKKGDHKEFPVGQEIQIQMKQEIAQKAELSKSQDDTITLTIQTTKMVESDKATITIEEDVTPMEAVIEEGGDKGLTYEQAVKLGLLDVGSGKFRDPHSGEEMNLKTAILNGLLDPNAPAIIDIKTGETYSLKDAFDAGLINQYTGQINPTRAQQLELTLDPQFSPRDRSQSPVNVEDAILSGLLDLQTGEVRHPKTGQMMTLKDAVDRGVIDGNSGMVLDPNTGKKVTVQEALDKGLIDGQTGDIINVETGKKLLSLHEAYSSGLVESTYSPEKAEVTDAESGQKVPIGKAITEGKVSGDDVKVYDAASGDRVPLDEAMKKGIVDRKTGQYIDKKSGQRMTAKEAAKLGLLAIVGAPVLGGMAVVEGIKKLKQITKDKTEKDDDTSQLKERRIIRDGEEEDEVPFPSQPMQFPFRRTPGESDPEAKKKTSEIKSSDTKTEIEPVRVAVDDGAITAKSKTTTETESKKVTQMKRVPIPVQKEEAQSIESQAKVSEPSPATTEYHKAGRIPIQTVPSPATIEYHRPRGSSLFDMDQRLLPGDDDASETKSMDLDEIMQAGSLQKPKPLEPPTTTSYRGATVVTQQRELTAKLTEDTEDGPVVHEGTAEWRGFQTDLKQEPGQVVDPRTGERVTIQEAIDGGLVDIDWKKGVITNTYTGEKLSPQEAVNQGLIDSHIAQLIANRQIVQSPLLGPMTLNDAVTRGLCVLQLGKIRHPSTGKLLTIEEAITAGLIDPHNSIILDPATGSQLTVAEAMRKGILDPKTGDVMNNATGNTLTFSEALFEGLIPEHGLAHPPPLTLKEAIRQGLVDAEKGQYKDPITGDIIDLPVAIERGYIAADEAEITMIIRQKINARKSPEESVQPMSIDEAIENGLVKNGQYHHPETGAVMSLTDAIKKGFLVEPSFSEELIQPSDKPVTSHMVTFPEDNILEFTTITETVSVDEGKGVTLTDALKGNWLVPSTGVFVNPKTGERMPFKEAVFDLQIKPDSAQVMDPVSRQPINLLEALEHNIMDQKGRITNPQTNQILTLEKAILESVVKEVPHAIAPVTSTKTIIKEITTLAVSEVIKVPNQPSISLAEAVRQGVIDKSKGAYVNPRTRQPMEIGDAYRAGLIKGNVLDVKTTKEEIITRGSEAQERLSGMTSVIDPVTKQEIPLAEALDRGIVDVDGNYIDPKTGTIMPITEAMQEGLIYKKERLSISKSVHQVVEKDPKQKVNIVGVLDPRTDQVLGISDAVQRGLFNDSTGAYTHPVTKRVYPLQDAIAAGFVITDEAKPVFQEKLLKIGAVKDIETGQWLSPQDAAAAGIVNIGEQTYMNPHTGDIISLEDALTLGLVSPEEEVEEEPVVLKQVTQTEKARQTFSIKTVIDPITREVLHPTEAVNRGVLDVTKGLYVNQRTGDKLSLHEAFDAGLIDAIEEDTTDAGKIDSTTATLESKEFTVIGAFDTRTGEQLPVAEAIGRGILNPTVSEYVDKKNGKKMPIKEAVEKGLVICSEGFQRPTSTSMVHETQSYAVKSVIDSRTGEEIPIADAVRHQIVDKEKNLYVDPATDEVMSLTDAIEKGLVLTETIEDAAKISALLQLGKANLYCLKSVKDLETGRWFNPVDAERRGLINKTAGIYINPVTGEKIPISEAIEKGYILADLLEEPDYDDLPKNAMIYATMEAVKETEEVQVQSVIDPRTGEELSVMEAISRGILDPHTGRYLNPDTMQTVSLEDAIDTGIVIARPEKAQVVEVTQTPRLTDTFYVGGIIDPRTGEKVSADEAIRRGLLDMEEGAYCDPRTGRKISLDEAASKGLLLKDYEAPLREELLHSTEMKMESQRAYATEEGHYPKLGDGYGAHEPMKLADVPSEAYGVHKNNLPQHHFLGGGHARDKGGGTISKPAPAESTTDEPASESESEKYPHPDVTSDLSSLSDTPLHDLTGVTDSLSFSSDIKPTSEIEAEKSPESKPPYARNIQDAHEKNMMDPASGLFVDPNTGRKMTVDEAILSGLIAEPSQFPSPEPRRKSRSMSFQEALQKGLLDPSQKTFTDPETGKTKTVESAVAQGLLRPTLPSAGGQEEPVKVNGVEKPTSIDDITSELDQIEELARKQEGTLQKAVNTMQYQEPNATKKTEAAKTPDLNGDGTGPASEMHDAPAEVYKLRKGFHMTPSGEVVNDLSGEVFSVQDAFDRGLLVSSSQPEGDIGSEFSTGRASTASSIMDRVRQFYCLIA